MNSASNLLNVARIRALEQASGNPEPSLMIRAGTAAAELAARLVRDDGQPVLVLAGPGNNGGDAFVAACVLRERGFLVCVLFAGEPSELPADAAAAYWAFSAAGGDTADRWPGQSARFSLVVDGVFGIGLDRPIGEPWRSWIESASALPCPRLAIDIPSGLGADNGAVVGGGPAFRATHTLTFLGLKPGLFTGDGVDYAGEIALDGLGVQQADTPPGALLRLDEVRSVLLPRRRNSHKGDFGTTCVIGGAPGMSGAAMLAADAALHLGAGRVYLHALGAKLDATPTRPEIMRLTDLRMLPGIGILVVGPGLGRTDDALAALDTTLELQGGVVLDADALYLLSRGTVSGGARRLRPAQTGGDVVLTPHPGEAGFLCGLPTEAIQSDRIGIARRIANEFQAVCVLKGAGTVIAAPDGRYWINTTGNPGLSAPGMGDVLAGAIGGLMAQGCTGLDAARLAVALHGAAADALAEHGIGPVGLTASEVLLEMRRLLNQSAAGGQKRPIR